MGLESATYISQLVATNPTAGDAVSQGDDHLTLIKRVLQAQFPGLGAAAVTPTAAQLNAVTAKLTSFNGRSSPTAIMPQEGDYTLTLLGDCTITTPVNKDVLRYNGTTWVNGPVGAVILNGCFLYDTYSSKVTDSVFFTNARRNTVPAGLGAIKNDGSGGIGWTFTAAAACLLHLDFQCVIGTVNTTQIAIGIFSPGSGVTAAIPGAGSTRLAYSTGIDTGSPDSFSVGGSAVLAAGDVVTVYVNNTTSPNMLTLCGSVIGL